MTELTLEHDGLLQIRQMTALLLKQYVDTHWSSLGEKFKGRQILVLRVFQRKFLMPIYSWLQIRQMTALLLKQYVDTHWSSLGEKFKGKIPIKSRVFLQKRLVPLNSGL